MILGANLGREFFLGGLKPWRNKAEKSVDKNSLTTLAEKVAGNFPKIRRTKLKKSPQIRTSKSTIGT